MPTSDQFPNYQGIRSQHSGGWTPSEYHSHQKAHPNKLQETSKKRAMKPRPRPNTFDSPKPTTKILDLSTGKRTDAKVEEALENDLKKRNLKH